MPPPYKPVNCCIYCGRLESVEVALGDEHIIPMAFGGTLILPKASCIDCGRDTSKFEGDCAENMLGPARYHLGIRGRHQKGPRKYARSLVDHGTHIESRKVPLAEHPAAIMMLRFWIPGVLLGITPTDNFAGKVAFRALSPDLPERARRLGGNGVNLTKGFSAVAFGLTLAKIAHSFAVAELGMEGFKPCLNDMIRGHPPIILAHYVGSLPAEETPPDSAERHEINFDEPYLRYDGQEFIRVRIRLFADQGMPVHQVVVGQPNTRTPRARLPYAEPAPSRIAGEIPFYLLPEIPIRGPHQDLGVPSSGVTPEPETLSPPQETLVEKQDYAPPIQDDAAKP